MLYAIGAIHYSLNPPIAELVFVVLFLQQIRQLPGSEKRTQAIMAHTFIQIANAVLHVAHTPTAQQVTVTFDAAQIVTWLIIGTIAGFLAGALIRGRRYGFVSSIIVGLIGAFVGGFLFTILHIPIPASLDGGITIRYIDIIVSFIGAVIVLLLLGLFYRRGPRGA